MVALRDGTREWSSRYRVLALGDRDATAALERAGHVGTPAIDVALEELTNERFDCLLIDASGSGGVDRLEEVTRLREGSPAVPIVAFCDDEAASAASATGVTAVVRAALGSLTAEEAVDELPVVHGRDDAGAGRHEAVADLGRRSLDGAPLAALLERAVVLVRDALSLDRCGAFELTAEGTLSLREGVGWEPGAGDDLAIDADDDSQAAGALAGEPVAGALGSETRLGGSDRPFEGVESGISVAVGSAGEPWGILGAYATDSRTFDGSDVGFVRSVANVLAGAVDRERADRRHLETELEEVYGRVTDAFVALDADARVTHLNDRAERLLGLPAERLVGTVIWEPFPPAFEETFREDYWEAMERQEPIERERYYPLLDRWYEGRAYPSESGLSVYFRDITDRKRTERRLHEERTLKDRIVETSPIGIVVTDVDGRMTFANERAQSIFGCSESEILARSHDDERWNAVDGNGDPLDPEQLAFARVKRTGTPVFDEEVGIDRSDGRRVWLSSNCAPLFDGDGEFDGAVYALEDVTDRRRLEKELDDLLGRVTDGFFGLDDEWCFTYLNERAEELINPENRDLLGESIWEQFPGAIDTTFEEEYRRAMETQQPVTFEEHYPEPLDAWFEVNAYPSETGLSVYFNEITERKEREQELELFHTLVDHSTDAIYVNDPETGEFLDVNETVTRHLGYAREELLGMTTSDVDCKIPTQAAWRETVEGIRARGERTVDTVHRRKDGSTYPAEINASYVELEGGREYVFAIGRDVSERKAHERALREERDLIERIVETSPVGIVTLDADGAFDLVNDRAEKIFGCSGDRLEELVGSTDAFDPIGPDGEPLSLEEIPTRRVLCGGETFHDIEMGFRLPDDERVWLSVSGTPLCDESGATAGGLVTFADVTERKEHEHELEQRMHQQHAIADLGQRALEVDDLDVLFQEACEIVSDVLENEYCKVLDLDAEGRELLLRRGVGWRDGIAGTATVAADENSQAGYTLLSKESVIVDDLDAETRFSGPDLLTSHGVVSGISVIIGPVESPWGILGTHDTERSAFTTYDANFVRSVANVLANAIDRIEHERELERYETIVETVNDGIYTIDETGRFTSVNRTYASMLGYDRDELVGTHASLVADDEVIKSAREIEQSMRAGEVESPTLEATLQTAGEKRFEAEATFALLPSDGGDERVGVIRDITERKRIERQLRLSAETLHGLYELTTSRGLSFEQKLKRVLEAGCERLDLEYGFFTRIEDDTMTIVQSHADNELYRPGASCPISQSYCRRVLEEEGLVVVNDALAEGWAGDPGYETFELGTYVGGQVVIDGEVYGTICFSSNDPREEPLSEVERTFVELVNGWASYELERSENQYELERQREQLASLDQLNAVIRDISHAILETTSREEIETAVCERLADRYRFAWIGAIERGTSAVSPTAAAGVEEGYLDEIEISLDPDAPSGRGPTAKAIRDHEAQFHTNVLEDPEYEPWQEAARERGYRSSAAIPIRHEGSLYGVLNVYSPCPEAFDGPERDILTHLGEILGHTVYAVEQRKALISDTVLELELRIDDEEHPLIEAASTAGAEITFQRTVPAAEGSMLQFVTVSGISAAAFRSAVEGVGSVERVTLLAETDDELTFELTLSESPLIDALAAFGGRLTTAMIRPGELRILVELPPNADVRAVVEAIEESHAGVKLLAQRTETHDGTTKQELRDVLADRLTEKQRAALETSYFAGYFDWPRGHTGEEVAELLGLSPATLSQHLRIAERKLFDALFTGS
ncbi:PAS domain S-box protein [Halalkalicoccus ordinarius]|uniref:PAS domain S-box protein n=1 Tax=Halalkalicoccus ordinarius TaxID=3116651 RepID=UPI00300F3DC8